MEPRARTGFMARRFDGRDAAVKVPLAGVSGRHYVRVTLTLGRLIRRVFIQFAEPRRSPARLHIIWSDPKAQRVSPSRRRRRFRGCLLRTGSRRVVSILVPTHQAIALRSP